MDSILRVWDGPYVQRLLRTLHVRGCETRFRLWVERSRPRSRRIRPGLGIRGCWTIGVGRAVCHRGTSLLLSGGNLLGRQCGMRVVGLGTPRCLGSVFA